MPRFRFVAFAPDGRTLATCTLGYEIKLWDLENASEVRRLTGHSDNITSAAFSGDGKVLITTSLDQTIRKWDVQTGKLLRTFRGHPQEVWDGVFSPDRTLFASAAKDGGIKVWDTTAAPPLEPLLSSTTPIGFHANGDLVCLGTNGFLAALDPHTLITNSARQIPAHSVSQFSARLGSLMNDGRTAVFATEEGTLRALDLEDGQFRCSIECRHPGFVAATDSQVIATRTSGRTVTLWQMPSGDPICVASNTSLALGFSDDERRLLIWGDNSPILLTKTGSTWAKASELPLRISVQGKAAFSPDGRMVASGDWGSLVSAFALPSGERLVSFVGHKREMCDLCFSPDSRTLATISDDNTVRLWQVATGRELMRFSMFLKDPQVAKLALRFSPDGRTLVAEGFDSERHNSRVFFAPSFGEIAVVEDTDYRAVTKTAADWLAVGKALVKRNRKEEALEALSEAIVRSDGNSLPTSVRTTALCYRSNLLAEIVQDVQRGVKVTHQ